MKKYYISEQLSVLMTASSKAREDCEAILAREGFQKLTIRYVSPGSSSFVIRAVRQLFYCMDYIRVFFRIHNGDVLAVQHPFKQNALLRNRIVALLRKRRRVKIIRIIHDIDSLRGGYSARHLCEDDSHLISDSDFLICHNARMKEYLCSLGAKDDRVIELGIFDYLLPDSPCTLQNRDRTIIDIAGNLDCKKSGYLSELPMDAGLRFQLYGINRSDNARGEYLGAFAPELLPKKLSGGFGLIWDGPSADTCTGDTGAYLRYNNPHKLSLYLAAGMPVIVWEQAAIAEFVNQNGIGICVSGIREAGERIASMSEKEYSEMAARAALLSQTVISGDFLRKALEKTGL